MAARRRRIAVVAFTLAATSCSSYHARVIVRNDSGETRHVFYCVNASCTEGIAGNEVVLKPGEQAKDYWNSPDSTGPIGVASYPNETLIGCLWNPSNGVDNPPTKTVLTSAAGACQTPSLDHPKVTIKMP